MKIDIELLARMLIQKNESTQCMGQFQDYKIETLLFISIDLVKFARYFNKFIMAGLQLKMTFCKVCVILIIYI
jgi:hypothetical protein